jgi:protein ImuA
MTESPSLSALKAHLAGFQAPAPPRRFTVGHARLDAALGGGLARAHLHEIWPAAAADGASATGYALMLALRAGGRGGNIVWIAEERSERRLGPLYPPGLAELGADPARFLFVNAPDDKALLRAAGDVVRSPAAGTAVIVPATPALFDLTATRRLTLFAERSGVTAILLRPADPQAPSAATTRWQVAAAPSTPLEAKAPGAPAFMVELVRQRAGAPVPPMRLEWDRDRAGFAEIPGFLPADAGGRLLEGVG